MKEWERLMSRAFPTTASATEANLGRRQGERMLDQAQRFRAAPMRNEELDVARVMV